MPTSGRPRRKALSVIAVLLVVIGAGFGVRAATAGEAKTSGPARTPVAYAEVTRQTLTRQQSLDGSLGYGGSRTIRADGGGVITWLPVAGVKIRRGQVVYRVNNRPVPLFTGRTPLYRQLHTVGQVGPDIRVIADNLSALGYSIGTQPVAGSVVEQIPPPASPDDSDPEPSTSATLTPSPQPTSSSTPAPRTEHHVRTIVRKGDGVLTPTVVAAIKSWQRDLGLPATGRIAVGSVLVQPRAVRVASITAQVGDPASGDLMKVTSTAKVITVTAEQGQAATLERGDVATVTLPDGRTTKARVSAIGTALGEDADDTGAPPKLTITLVLDRPSVMKKVDSADLEVAFAAETHPDVLAVPVGALVALSEGGYAVQPQTGPLLAVDIGMFEQGLVEIDGAGITEGLNVVTTS